MCLSARLKFVLVWVVTIGNCGWKTASKIFKSFKSVKASFTRVMACDRFLFPCQSDKSNNSVFWKLERTFHWTDFWSLLFFRLFNRLFVTRFSLLWCPEDVITHFSLQLGSVVSTGGSCASTSTSIKDTPRSGEMRDKSSSPSAHHPPYCHQKVNRPHNFARPLLAFNFTCIVSQ